MTSNEPIIGMATIAFLIAVGRFYFAKDYRANMNPVLHLLTWLLIAAGFVFEGWYLFTYALPHR